jgi:hypothetical protein
MSHHVVPRLFEGETIACLATGPSLTPQVVEACRGRVRTIAINDAHRLAPWADCLYSSDRRWWPFYQGVPSFTGMKYGIGSGPMKRNPFAGLPDIRVLKNTGYLGLELDPGGLRNGRNSGFAALNLAVHFGAKRILLLGYNMSHAAGPHFFGSHPQGLTENASLYPGFRRNFESMVEPLRALGVEVFNCTENSSLDAFPRRALADVLPAERHEAVA